LKAADAGFQEAELPFPRRIFPGELGDRPISSGLRLRQVTVHILRVNGIVKCLRGLCRRLRSAATAREDETDSR
jgi:hypothetical protein